MDNTKYKIASNPMGVYNLNIDSCMVVVERIMRGYIDTTTNQDASVYYVRGQRLPLLERKNINKYNTLGILQQSPWHPYLAIPLLLDLLEYYQYLHTSHAALFMANPMDSDAGAIYNVSTKITDTAIILTYIPGISTDDHYAIANAFLDIHRIALNSIFTEYPDSVYRLDTVTDKYVLLRYDDIRVFRYNELIEGKENK